MGWDDLDWLLGLVVVVVVLLLLLMCLLKSMMMMRRRRRMWREMRLTKESRIMFF
jgi:type II secretory pathway pseudopilin PulG